VENVRGIIIILDQEAIVSGYPYPYKGAQLRGYSTAFFLVVTNTSDFEAWTL
jgi:hypothetical protein